MQDGYKITDQSLPHFITATVIDWIDVFSRKNYPLAPARILSRNQN